MNRIYQNLIRFEPFGALSRNSHESHNVECLPANSWRSRGWVWNDIMPVVTSNLTTPTTVPTMSNDGTERPADEKSVYLDVVDALTDRFLILFYVSDFVTWQVRQPLYPVRAAILKFTESKIKSRDNFIIFLLIYTLIIFNLKYYILFN